MSEVDTKLMRAAIAVLEAGTFSQAAVTLKIGQSGLTKQIMALEEALGFSVFSREGRTIVPTEAGEIFIAEARLSLEHHQRAILLGRAATAKAEITLHLGKSPYTDPYLMSQVFALRLPLSPRLKVLLTTNLAQELAQKVLNGTLDLAFITGLPETARLTSVIVAEQNFFVAMLDDDPLASGQEVVSEQLQSSSCILFERHVHPFLYEEVIRLVRPANTAGCAIHHFMTAEDAALFIQRGLGVAVLTRAGAWRIARKGMTIRPLVVPNLKVQTRLTCRSDSQDRTVRDFVRTYVKLTQQNSQKQQLSFRLAA